MCDWLIDQEDVESDFVDVEAFDDNAMDMTFSQRRRASQQVRWMCELSH